MAAGQRERREYTDAFKRKAVERLLAGRLTIAEFCEDKDIGHTVVRKWCRDPRYGGKPGAFTKPNGTASGGLPTKAAEHTTTRKAKPPIPTAWKCPHCDGPLAGDRL